MTPKEVLSLLKEAADTFTAISGKPADNDLTRVEKVIYPLLLSVPYNQAKGTHNLRGIITPQSAYSKTYGDPFPIPTRPASYSTSIKKDATDGERRHAEAVHKGIQEDFNLCSTGKHGTKAFLMANVDETWYQELEDPDTYYTEVTALQLMDHLRLRSGGRHAIDAVDIIAEMGTLFAEAHSIAEYINASDGETLEEITPRRPPNRQRNALGHRH